MQVSAGAHWSPVNSCELVVIPRNKLCGGDSGTQPRSEGLGTGVGACTEYSAQSVQSKAPGVPVICCFSHPPLPTEKHPVPQEPPPLTFSRLEASPTGARLAVCTSAINGIGVAFCPRAPVHRGRPLPYSPLGQ